MAVRDVLYVLFETRNITSGHAAAAIGVPRASLWDLIGAENEIQTFDVDHIVRTCLVFKVAPSALLIEEHADFGEPSTLPDAIYNKFGEVDISAYVRSICPPYDSIAEEVGWDSDGLERWLSIDSEFYHMPYPALVDLCRFLGIHPSSVLDALWRAIGQMSE